MGTMKQHVAGAVSMLLGAVLVFGLILVMNHFMTKFEKKPEQTVTEISMTRESRQEPKKEVRKVEPKRQVTRSHAPEPFRGLDTALSGIDLGLLGLEGGQRELDERLLGNTGNAVMTSDLVDIPPKPVTRASFKYPPAAKKKGIKGYVLLSVLVDADGSVNQVQVLESSPSGLFDSAALQGIRSWHFEPARYKGEAVRVWAKQRIRFDLS